jgi:hypothetical protein
VNDGALFLGLALSSLLSFVRVVCINMNDGVPDLEIANTGMRVSGHLPKPTRGDACQFF